jgi:hypothetical protein
MNALLQMLYVLPATHYALKTHISGVDVSLSDELGFLYHIMDQARHLSAKDKSVEPLNFLRYFRNVPEAAALGLLDEDKLDMVRRIGACTRFMLEHINKELKSTDMRAGKGGSTGYSTSASSLSQSQQNQIQHQNQGDNNNNNGIKTGIHSGSPLSSPTHASPQDQNFLHRLGETSSGLADLCHPSGLGGAVIEQWFGCTFNNMDQFKSGAKKERETRSFVVDFKYPQILTTDNANEDKRGEGSSKSSAAGVVHATGTNTTTNTGLNAHLPSFLDVLKESMTRKVRVLRAWCEESKEYEPLVKTRTPKRMPPILCLNVVPSESEAIGEKKDWMDMWRSKRPPLYTTAATTTENPIDTNQTTDTTSSNNNNSKKQRRGHNNNNKRQNKKGSTIVVETKEAILSRKKKDIANVRDQHQPLHSSVDEHGMERWLLPSFVVRTAAAAPAANSSGSGSSSSSNQFHVTRAPVHIRTPEEATEAEHSAQVMEKRALEAALDAGKARVQAAAATKAHLDAKAKHGNKGSGGKASASNVAHMWKKVEAARKKASEKQSEHAVLSAQAKAARFNANTIDGTGTMTYDLVGVLSHVRDPLRPTTHGHVILHANVYDDAVTKAETGTETKTETKPKINKKKKKKNVDTATTGTGTGTRSWYAFNDVAVTKVSLEEVLSFDRQWRTPCVVLYELRHNPSSSFTSIISINRPLVKIKPTVFLAPSLSRQQSNLKPTFTQVTIPHTLLRPKDVCAIDCEFVSTASEESHINSEGRRVVTKDSTLALARVSCLRANGEPFLDDYIQKSEPIMDYLTRFSGLIHGDLDASTSPHHLVSLKTAYLKLRWLVDNGIIFVGHGLSKDFRMINMHVPESQIVDTVHLFHLPGQRYVGLRFLIRYFFGADEGIQDASRGHDSIEDAWGALRLYNKHEELKKDGALDEMLSKLYEDGHRCGWKN